jgi:hypothetical protein
MKLLTLVPLIALGVAACSGGNKAADNTGANAQNAATPAANDQNATASTNGQGPAAGGTLTPAEVRSMIERDGAAATVRLLSQGGTPAAPNRFATLEDGIARGDQAWLDLVPLIRSGADGETATGITMSLGDALPKNAAGVLRLIANKEDAASVCDDSLSEMTADQRREQREAAIAAVEAVKDPALQQAKTNCLATLRAPASQ